MVICERTMSLASLRSHQEENHLRAKYFSELPVPNPSVRTRGMSKREMSPIMGDLIEREDILNVQSQTEHCTSHGE